MTPLGPGRVKTRGGRNDDFTRSAAGVNGPNLGRVTVVDALSRCERKGYPGTVIRAGATAVVQAYPQVRIFCIIAAVPRIAMTRLRLYARTWRLISVLTCSRVFIRKCAAPIQNFSVPNGCSTV